jgi:hypothetical protein
MVVKRPAVMHAWPVPPAALWRSPVSPKRAVEAGGIVPGLALSGPLTAHLKLAPDLDADRIGPRRVCGRANDFASNAIL